MVTSGLASMTLRRPLPSGLPRECPSTFIDRGGTLLLMGVWNDHTLGPGNNVHYYQTVLAKMERPIGSS